MCSCAEDKSDESCCAKIRFEAVLASRVHAEAQCEQNEVGTNERRGGDRVTLEIEFAAWPRNENDEMPAVGE
jgi:hypothetical protein